MAESGYQAVYSTAFTPILSSFQFPVKLSFSDRLAALRLQKKSVLCVGLDPDPARLPASLGPDADLPGAIIRFCTDIISATSTAAIAFKINFAFFEALGDEGMKVMRTVLNEIPKDVLTIADAKRGDIGNSASFYARSVFDDLGYDSVTVSPYMGKDSVVPFLSTVGTCAFVLARTSNPGGNDFQPLQSDGKRLFERVADRVAVWGSEARGEGGLVVGATDIDDMRILREKHPGMPFLIPGVGAQGGSAEDVMRAAGSGPVLVNSSRAILYASNGADFAQKAAQAAEETRNTLGS